MRFGVLLIPNSGWPKLRTDATLAESLGFETVWIDDHGVNPNRPRQLWMDSWTSLGALAECTHGVRLGTLVSNTALRSPAMLARHAATLHQVSGGRVELGIGAGYASTDHQIGGTAVWGNVERLARFDEAAGLVRALLEGGPVTSAGAYYPVEDLQLLEAGGDRPRITVGAHDDRSLRVAARYGDAWNSFGGWGLTSDQMLRRTAGRNSRLDDECVALGRDPSTLRRSLLAGNPAVTPDPIWSSVEVFEDFIGRYHGIGIDEIVFYFPPQAIYRDGFDQAVLEAAVADVLPRWRSKEPTTGSVLKR